MKTVIQIVQHLAPGGIETMSLDLHRYYLEKGYDSHIISLEGERHRALKKWPVLTPYASKLHFMQKPQKFSLLFLLKLIRYLHKLKVQQLHTHHLGPLIYGGLAATLLRPEFHTHTEHDAWHLENPQHRRLQSWMLRIARPALVADADTVASAVQRFLHINAPEVIPNGIDTRLFTPGDQNSARRALGLPLDKIIVGCSGRLEKVKGHAVLIQAIMDCPPTVQLALAGDGSELHSLRTLSQQLGLQQRVHFLGRLDNMPQFYQALDCFCLPSFQEGMPLSPLEAQSCAIPAVVTDVGGARESLCPHSGVLTDSGNPAALAQAILHSLNSVSGVSPRDWVTRHADIQQTAARYASLTCQPC